ncbi:restriction endonuclease [Rhodococcus opacus]|nr:restriction endonuclease [Rhodococcus opacus]
MPDLPVGARNRRRHQIDLGVSDNRGGFAAPVSYQIRGTGAPDYYHEVIFSSEPDNWRDLQEKVADVLRISGFDPVSIEKTIEQTRGSVDVDVYAVDPATSPELIYICECKHWSTPVPRTVVHAFQTVVAQHGAHLGLIVSRNGFQSGAYEAAQQTNIKLVNWFEFQQLS